MVGCLSGKRAYESALRGAVVVRNILVEFPGTSLLTSPRYAVYDAINYLL